MFKIKFKKMNWFVSMITFGWASAITLSPFGIYIKEKYFDYVRTRNHESIHWEQQLELWIIGFYVLYLLEWFIRLFINGRNAYMRISFEQESYGNANNLDYLKTRKKFAWVKYLKK